MASDRGGGAREVNEGSEMEKGMEGWGEEKGEMRGVGTWGFERVRKERVSVVNAVEGSDGDMADDGISMSMEKKDSAGSSGL